MLHSIASIVLFTQTTPVGGGGRGNVEFPENPAPWGVVNIIDNTYSDTL